MRCAQAQENFQHPNEDTDTTAQHSSNNGGGASWQRGKEKETRREATARKKEKKTGQEKSIKRRNNFLPPFCLLRLVLLRLRNFHSWLIRKVSSLLALLLPLPPAQPNSGEEGSRRAAWLL